MKKTRYDLEQIELGGLGGSLTHYKVDGRRVECAEFNRIKHGATRLECLSNANRAGVWHFWSVAVYE